MLTMVMNLSTCEKIGYSLEPIEAVVAAYAQNTRHDYNTWNYHKYVGLVVSGEITVACGDWCALLRT